MTDAQKAHVESLLGKFQAEATEKYSKGAEEHGGNIWDIPATKLLDNAIEEAIDLIVYLYTLRNKLSNPSNHSSLQQCVREVQKAIREKGL